MHGLSACSSHQVAHSKQLCPLALHVLASCSAACQRLHAHSPPVAHRAQHSPTAGGGRAARSSHPGVCSFLQCTPPRCMHCRRTQLLQLSAARHSPSPSRPPPASTPRSCSGQAPFTSSTLQTAGERAAWRLWPGTGRASKRRLEAAHMMWQAVVPLDTHTWRAPAPELLPACVVADASWGHLQQHGLSSPLDSGSTCDHHAWPLRALQAASGGTSAQEACPPHTRHRAPFLSLPRRGQILTVSVAGCEGGAW